MGDIALRGNKLTKGPHGHGPKPFLNSPGQAQGTHGGKATGGRVGKFGGGRTRLLEELGRVEAAPSNRNRRAEIARVHGELNRGYAKGGAVRKLGKSLRDKRTLGRSLRGKEKTFKTHGKDVPTMAAEGGRIGFKKGSKAKNGLSPAQSHYLQHGYGPHKRDKKAFGGRVDLKEGGKSDKNWIQKVNKSIKARGTKGKCTPITKPGCTGRAKALAKTFKKMAAKRKAKG